MRRATRCSKTRAASPTACPPTTRCSGARAAWARVRWSRRSMPRSIARAERQGAPRADGNPPRRDREPAGAAAHAARRRAPLPALLRRPFLRQGRHELQIAQGRARRRHRRPAGECPLLRHVEPPPSDAARHDGERTLDRDQSVRSRGRESLAVGSLRAVARLPQLQPGRISRDDRRLCRALRHRARRNA